MSVESLQLIGYFPKRVPRQGAGIRNAAVQAIRSVSNCMSQRPDDWVNRWMHNAMWVYDTVAAARAVIPAGEEGGYEIQAYRMLPMKWEDGKGCAVTIPELGVEPLRDRFRSVGFDVVSFDDGCGGFGCSPLSCNGMANEIAVNAHCLLDELERAKEVAMAFSCGNVEPGPYSVVEVLVERGVGRARATAAVQD